MNVEYRHGSGKKKTLGTFPNIFMNIISNTYHFCVSQLMNFERKSTSKHLPKLIFAREKLASVSVNSYYENFMKLRK